MADIGKTALAPGEPTASPLDRVGDRIMADDAVQLELAAFAAPEPFVARVAALAGAWDIRLSRETVMAALGWPARLGAARLGSVSAGVSNQSSPHWLPVRAVSVADGSLAVDWAHFGVDWLREPFFSGSADRALARPFNRMFRVRGSLHDLVRNARPAESLEPSGFIFHMSRCGSTLVAQMLAARDDCVVVSEAPPLDAAAQLGSVPALRAMVAALGRRRMPSGRHYVLKLDSWHSLALPLFRAAFPETPWIFLYRDPAEVLASQMRMRGSQTVLGMMPPALTDPPFDPGLDQKELCARVLDRMCAAACDHWSLGGGLLINYAQLPDAIDAILDHFGIPRGGGARDAMAFAARRDAKMPSQPHAPPPGPEPDIRAVAARHMGETYRRLEMLRGAAGSP